MRTITKPKIKLTGQSGNIFVLGSIASRALKKSGQEDKSDEMKGKIRDAKSYDEAIQVIMDYL